MHKPVLKKEVIELLNPKPNENFIDATFGEGGHTKEILKKIKPKGKILAIEFDPVLYNKFLKHPLERVIIVNDSFVNLREIARKKGFENPDGILFDLGVTLWHFKQSKRGFSFERNEPLDMRINPKKQKLKAKHLINQLSQEEIEEILKKYGEERFARKIAKELVKKRKKEEIKTTFQLIEVLKKALPRWYQKRKIHFATKVFQALRIAVNDELENLKVGLNQAIEILKKGGRLGVISFHSLEDRIVKKIFKEWERERKVCILTKKPITPSFEEIKTNPSSRSAKLRVVKKL